MKIIFRTAAFAAFVLTAASFGLAVAAAPAKADGWHRGNVWVNSYGHGRGHGHGRNHYRRGDAVVVFRTAPVYAPSRRIVVVRPAPVVVQQAAPVIVQQPAPVMQQSAAAYCREYIETVTVAGAVQTAYGTACMQPDGSWQKQN